METWTERSQLESPASERKSRIKLTKSVGERLKLQAKKQDKLPKNDD